MSSSAPAATDSAELLPLDLAEAGAYATERDGLEHGLVVLATGNPYWLVPESEQRHRLLVEASALAHVRDQIERFDRERLNWPPRPFQDVAAHATDAITPLLWALAVLVIFNLQVTHPQWVERGALDPQAVFDRGEWWRPLTALFLHGDLDHVISNTASGVFVFMAVLKTLGRLRGWLALTAAALLGNLAAAGAHYAHAYRSIGASTALFAGVGLLTGRALWMAARSSPLQRWSALLPSLGSGVVVLALYGAGGQRVDVVAHLTGFAAGLALGFMLARAETKSLLQ